MEVDQKEKNKYPFIRVSEQAKEHVRQIVALKKAQGLRVSESSITSEMLLSIPLPIVTVKKPRTRKAATSAPAVSVA